MQRLLAQRQSSWASLRLRRPERLGRDGVLPIGFVRAFASGGDGDDKSRQIGLLRNYLADNADGATPSASRRFACFARAVRKHRSVTFLALTDGSLHDQSTLQAVVRGDLLSQYNHRLAPGVALEVVGRLQASKGKGQTVELVVEEMQVTGDVDAATYPIRLVEASGTTEAGEVAATATTTTGERPVDLLRRNAHLRPRDSRHAAVLRTRDAVEGAMADYLRTLDFVRVAAPILTASDCEGGGEVFRVEAAAEMDKARSEVTTSAAGAASTFWSDSKAYLTVSAQLHLEAMALGLGRVYTVGPSFRAEGSATNRHLAEFWMCEGEQLTSQDEQRAMDEVTDVVEGVVKTVIRRAMLEKEEQSRYLWNGNEEKRQGLLACLTSHGDRWPRMTYTEAIEELAGAGLVGGDPPWGASLSSEQERWLARDGPLFVTHYPAAGKPFYMRLSDIDERTVACFDLLVPRIGELVGGSLRETRTEVIEKRMGEQQPSAVDGSPSSLSGNKLSWYVDDLRRYGCNPHGGFGLGVERLLSWITNTDSVRDVVTFPRAKGPLHF